MKRNTLFVITARGGSKGIPGKNIKALGGKPLIYYAIEEARKVAEDCDICVSTDSIEIKEKVEEVGLEVPFLRPKELAQDESGSYEVLIHALDYYKSQGITYEKLVILQPTSPFRTAQHIREAIELYEGSIDMVVSVFEAKSNPYYNLYEEDSNGFLSQSKKGNITRRQDAPKVYEYNGAVYVIKVDSLYLNNAFNDFSKIRKYIMSHEDSLDLDTLFDWKLCELLIEEKKH